MCILQDLEQFKDQPTYVKCIESPSDSSSKTLEKDGVLELELVGLACPNFKNGPKNGLSPLGVNKMQLCQKSVRKNDNLVIQKSYNFFTSNVKNEVIKISLQAVIQSNRYR